MWSAIPRLEEQASWMLSRVDSDLTNVGLVMVAGRG